MYNLKYNKNVIFTLKNFIDSYKNGFIRLIKDSGLPVEDIIIQNYINIGNKLYENIINDIEKNLKNDKILGEYIENNYKKIIFTVSNFRLFIYYTDNHILKERKIFKIKFNKK